MAGDDLGGDSVRVTQRWAEIMDKTDEISKSGVMRWNRLVFKRNSAQAEELRVW